MTHLRAFRSTFAVVALVLIVAGCGASVPVVSPSPPSSLVTLPEDALARVITTEPRLTGIAPLDPDAVGQASWYEVAPASGVGAFVVSVRIGWGDCQAGCIDEHTWVYAVRPDGTVSVVSESGPPVPADAWPNASG